jgi:hypothetical protein
MFQNSRFSKNARKMNKYEIVQGLAYFTQEDIIKCQTECSHIFSRNPNIPSIPTKIEQDKLEEALKLFGITPKE